MQNYEAMYICDVQLEEEEIEALIEKFSQIVDREGGQVTNLDKWGKRKLAYEMNKHTEGYYAVMNFTAPSHTTKELERIFKITDGVIRYLIVREEE